MNDPVLTPMCPGATVLDGPPASGPTVICGPMMRDGNDDGLAVFRGSRDKGKGGSPGVVYGYCCAAYTHCDIWQAEKKRIASDAQELGV